MKHFERIVFGQLSQTNLIKDKYGKKVFLGLIFQILFGLVISLDNAIRCT
jgi:hypothetical protein